jgi:hypothetical protein
MPDDPSDQDEEPFGRRLKRVIKSVTDYVSEPEAAGRIPPGQITELRASHLAPTHVSLTWKAPATGTKPIRYVVFFRRKSSDWWTVGATTEATSAEVTDLRPDTEYFFEVEAFNT